VTAPTQKRLKRNAIILAGLVLLGLVLDQIVFPLPYDSLFRPQSTFVYSREGRMLSCYTSTDRFWRRPVKLEEISPRLVQSVMAMEDRYFYYHPGFNPASMVSAAVDNIKAGRIKRGGSTLSMQIARMMEPKSRTISNKMLEILRAFQLEIHYSKDQLLEIYFNLVPYGGNIEGVGAAAYFYFEKHPHELSWSEAAILTAIPASPNKFRPDRNLDLCRKRRDRVLNTLVEQELITKDQAFSASGEVIPTARVTPPQMAPHFAQTAALNYAGLSSVRSTVDYDIQRTCERAAGHHHARLRSKDIHNLSIVVLDNQTGQLLAMVGSPDFADFAHSGQVNGAVAKRSPGSTLKPFVYGLAFDEGLASPLTRLEDIPVNYSGYKPVNYDEQYHGLVALDRALIRSYNVPVVNLTSHMGLSRVHAALRRGGLTTIDRPYLDYGLPLVLGACEVRLVDLANLYSSLARGGVVIPVTDTLQASTGQEQRVLSPEASYLITDILSRLERSDLPTAWQSTTDMPRVAWKTGTSFGRKDAWSIGYNPEYTVGVWAGNFDATGSADIVGALIATPIVLDIFREISGGENATWFRQPDRVSERRVCAVSGQVPGRFCEETVGEKFIPGVSPSTRCEIHQRIHVSTDKGHRLCRHCAHDVPKRDTIVSIFPAKAATWLARTGVATGLPAHNPNCPNFQKGAAPVITSPESDGTYYLVQGRPLQYQRILLEASAADGHGRLHWFVDGEHLESSGTNERVFYQPEPGSHTLTCSDNQGRATSIEFVVESSGS